jgi:hypothetical protein
MTTIIIANSIAAAAVVAGLAAVIRMSHLTAGGRLDRTPRPLELQRGARAQRRTPDRLAA